MLRITPGSWLASVAFAAACSCTGLALADTVWTRSGNNAPAKTEGTVLQVSIADKQLRMQNTSGTEVLRDLDSVVKIKVDSEGAFSEAEEAFEGEKWDAAAAAYDKALVATKKDWIKDRSVSRMVAAAGKSGQFPLMANAYAQLASRVPVGAESSKPAIPTDKAAIAKAIPLVERVNAVKQSELVRQFLAQLYIATERYDDVAKLFPAGAAKDPSIVVLQAMVAAKKGNYAAAIQAIEANRAVITQPDQQFDALYTLAEAKAGLAASDPAKAPDAAIAYMRVVAHFGQKNDARVVQAIFKTGELLEKAGQPTEAAVLYNQIANDDRDKVVAAEAKKKAELLKNARPSK